MRNPWIEKNRLPSPERATEVAGMMIRSIENLFIVFARVTRFYRPFRAPIVLGRQIQGRRTTLRYVLAPGYLMPRFQR